MSVFDKNRFSRVDAQDDRGMSLRVDYQQLFEFKKKEIVETEESKNKKADWKLRTNASYEFKENHFQALSPYRNAEFSRDWNIATAESLDEHLASVGLRLDKNKWGTINYDFGGFLRDTAYQGFKHTFGARMNRSGYKLIMNV